MMWTGVVLNALALLLPLQNPPSLSLIRMQSLDDTDSGDSEPLLSPSDMATLRARIARIQENGLSTPATAYFEMATEKPPGLLLREFFAEAPPEVQQAMQDAVVQLFGALPPMQFDTRLTTTGDRLAALMLQLQMTGYMLRNAQYVVAIRGLLNITTAAPTTFRAAFDSLDTDSSGFIEVEEVKALFNKIYEGKPPPYEVASFIQLFDANEDGRISYDEFLTALGYTPSSSSLEQPALAAGGGGGPTVDVSGTVTVTFDEGKQVEVDAEAYMSELRAEAEQLRAELAKLQGPSPSEAAISTSLSAYIASLPETQLKVLTQGISEDVVSAMRSLVQYILKVPGEDGAPREMTGKDSVSVEREKLQQLCLYQ